MSVKRNISWKSMIPITCYNFVSGDDHHDNCILGEYSEKRFMKQSSDQQRMSLSDVSSGQLSADDLSNSIVGSKLYKFSMAELTVMTHDFSRSNLLGEGGFGPVYKGFVDEKTKPGLEAQPVAVKLLNLDGSQGHREWLAEIIFLGQLRHAHLVKLIGYCWEEDYRLLVYEYMPRGSLDKHLFNIYSAALPWSTRMEIAVGAAKGLAFLHEADAPVIYRDFKASNILLDSDYTPKLSDFGLAKEGWSEGEEDKRIMGTKGYTAPEYIMNGQLTIKSDVYSFGVFILELLTGKKSMSRTKICQSSRDKIGLVEWSGPFLKDTIRKLYQVMDPRLEGQYSIKGAEKAARLAHKCLSHRPKTRPSMGEVVSELESLLGFEDLFFRKPFVYIVPNEVYSGMEEDDEGGNGPCRPGCRWRCLSGKLLKIIS